MPYPSNFINEFFFEPACLIVRDLFRNFEPIPVKSFSPFSELFELIFNPKFGVNIDKSILTPNFGLKISQKSSKNGRKILLGLGS